MDIKFKPDPKPDFTGQKIARQADHERRKAEAAAAHRRFYNEVWRENPHKCYECGEAVTKFHPRHIHHLVEKHLQDRYWIDLDRVDNGVVLCWSCHNQVHTNIAKTPKVQALTFLKEKEYEQFRIRK